MVEGLIPKGGKAPEGESSTTSEDGKTLNGGPPTSAQTDPNQKRPHSRTGEEFEDDEPVFKKPKFELKHVRREKEENDWEIPGDLADFFQFYCKSHITDSDMAAEMLHFPPPKNVECVPVLDAWMRKALTDEGKNTAREQDCELQTIQKKIFNVMGPLGVAWASLELHRADKENNPVDIDDICEQL